MTSQLNMLNAPPFDTRRYAREAAAEVAGQQLRDVRAYLRNKGRHGATDSEISRDLQIQLDRQARPAAMAVSARPRPLPNQGQSNHDNQVPPRFSHQGRGDEPPRDRWRCRPSLLTACRHLYQAPESSGEAAQAEEDQQDQTAGHVERTVYAASGPGVQQDVSPAGYQSMEFRALPPGPYHRVAHPIRSNLRPPGPGARRKG